MFQLVYVSSAVVPFDKQDLIALLSKSRQNNTRAGITGLLLYKDGNFMQALEGEEEAVRATHDRIRQDPRHRGLITLLQSPIEGRRFGEWAMGFRDLKSPEVLSIPGFHPFLNRPLNDPTLGDRPAECERLLMSFRRAM